MTCKMYIYIYWALPRYTNSDHNRNHKKKHNNFWPKPGRTRWVPPRWVSNPDSCALSIRLGRQLNPATICIFLTYTITTVIHSKNYCVTKTIIKNYITYILILWFLYLHLNLYYSKKNQVPQVQRWPCFKASTTWQLLANLGLFTGQNVFLMAFRPWWGLGAGKGRGAGGAGKEGLGWGRGCAVLGVWRAYSGNLGDGRDGPKKKTK